MSVTAFTVLSEFRFDVAQAIYGSEQLQGSVEKLSGAVDNAMTSAKNMGIGLAMQFTNAQAGIGGLLYSIISSSDKFTNSQLSIVQTIDSNMEHLTGTIGTMNEKMMVSQKIMQDIQKDAQHFGLSGTDLLNNFKTLNNMLVPKGLAGDNFKNSRDMSRNLLKSSSSLGIDPVDVQGQLLRAIEGSASMGDTLFRRLISEAPEPFKQAKVKDAKGFNLLDTTKRFEVLSEAMKKFANNTQILEARANTLSGTMQRFKDLLYGPFSVLKKIGDVIMPLLVQALQRLADWIQKDGQKIIDNIARVLKGLLENPREFLMQLMQLKSLSSDLGIATKLAGLSITIIHLKELFHFLSGLPIIGPAITSLVEFIKNIQFTGKLLEWTKYLFSNFGTILTNFVWPALRVLFNGLVEFGGWIAVFLIPLQGLSRAIARMKLESAEWFANNLADISTIMADLSHSFGVLMTPVQDIIKGFEELFFLIIGGTYLLDGGKSALSSFADIVKWFAEGIMLAWSAIRGVIAGMMEFISTVIGNIQTQLRNIMNGNFSNFDIGTENAFSNFGKAFMEEMDKSFNRVYNPTMDGNVDNAKVVSQVNNYDVKMNNNFKEVLQPDRIAFTIKEQLEKAQTNRTSAKGNSFASKTAKAV